MHFGSSVFLEEDFTWVTVGDPVEGEKGRCAAAALTSESTAHGVRPLEGTFSGRTYLRVASNLWSGEEPFEECPIALDRTSSARGVIRKLGK